MFLREDPECFEVTDHWKRKGCRRFTALQKEIFLTFFRGNFWRKRNIIRVTTSLQSSIIYLTTSLQSLMHVFSWMGRIRCRVYHVWWTITIVAQCGHKIVHICWCEKCSSSVDNTFRFKIHISNWSKDIHVFWINQNLTVFLNVVQRNFFASDKKFDIKLEALQYITLGDEVTYC